MKRLFIIASLALLGTGAWAQDNKAPKGYVFTTVDSLPITSIKDQAQSGTCWSFSSIGFFESELIRLGKGEHDLAEMFVVHKTMEDRAKAAVRLHGDIEFAQGGSFYDVVYCWKNYGMVPQEVMPGIMYKSDRINHNELTAVATAYVNALAKGNLKKLSDVWQKGFSGIYDAYVGECPEKFTYNGKEYTPKSYAESLGLNMDDYISLTSYTHHPFYEQFIIEIQDNWRWGLSYNLPLDEFMEVMHNAIKKGYTFAWGADVSEPGFTRDSTGLCIIPAQEDKEKSFLKAPCQEKEITQELRQEGYDNWETTDDHGMQIFGIAKDQNGKEYFMVKNSWNTTAGRKGIWYASDAYVAYKTINILVHKDAIPKEIKKKLGIK
ncbi:MAG: aminopeptidase [Bacteroidaceae bacterium]|jgi:aminopeptidase C|nr:aminopeptidase [Bacteroidaceae bacterium]